MNRIASANDKPLFTPGPLTPSRTVKQAMLRDPGSRDGEFVEIVRPIRSQLVGLAGLAASEYECILMQDSGTFSVEAVLGSTVPPDGKVLILANGAYGRRLVQMAKMLRIAHTVIKSPEECETDARFVTNALASDDAITNIAMVHCFLQTCKI